MIGQLLDQTGVLRVVAIGGLIMALLSGVYLKGRSDGKHVATEACQAATAQQWKDHTKVLQAQQQVTADLAAKTLTLSNDYARNLTAVVVESQRVLLSVQNRPARPPAPVPGASAPARTDSGGLGATGAQLYREDSQFLIGEAARADEIRLALTACTAQYEAVRASRVPPR